VRETSEPCDTKIENCIVKNNIFDMMSKN
jgi:hypothetical protein